ncbi:MAG: hypothetical protein VYE77_03795 [Planctomycetota bacterium]|nr:hypothetical protein [Planctomycetota bacterium]
MPRRPRKRAYWWADMPTEELLDVRLCDLELRIEGSALQRRVDRLYAELQRKKMRFRPYVWLSTDWFTPERTTGFAIPFYLAHPRLTRIERSQMLEAEGSTADWCMRLLRHETGHALDNAYRLHHRKIWRETFGYYSEPYRSDYRPRPSSKNFVQNLGHWYAQSHPAEDYAESFAVWLMPRSSWRRTYEGWPALNKLETLNELLQDLRRAKPKVRTRDRPESLPRVKRTLREHYACKKADYHKPQTWTHDRELSWLFTEPSPAFRRERAATFLHRMCNELRTRVSSLTGHHRYVVDQALHAMITRCKELDLRLMRSRQQTRLGSAVLLTMITLTYANGRKPVFRR